MQGRLNSIALTNIHRPDPLLQQLDTLRMLKAWDTTPHRRVKSGTSLRPSADEQTNYSVRQ